MLKLLLVRPKCLCDSPHQVRVHTHTHTQGREERGEEGGREEGRLGENIPEAIYGNFFLIENTYSYVLALSVTPLQLDPKHLTTGTVNIPIWKYYITAHVFDCFS